MSEAAPKPCRQAGCGALVRDGSGYCVKHLPAAQARRREQLAKAGAEYNERRPESDKFYSTAAWRKCRAGYLSRYPWCCECDRFSRLRPAVIVDHIIPYRERADLGLVESNLRSLCRACHNAIGKRVRS